MASHGYLIITKISFQHTDYSPAKQNLKLFFQYQSFNVSRKKNNGVEGVEGGKKGEKKKKKMLLNVVLESNESYILTDGEKFRKSSIIQKLYT